MEVIPCFLEWILFAVLLPKMLYFSPFSPDGSGIPRFFFVDIADSRNHIY
jgi:hypothetical protein